MSLAAGIRKGARDVTWYMRGVMGEDAYDKYLAYHATAHGDDDHPPMSERDFWRDRDDRRDSDPGARCC